MTTEETRFVKLQQSIGKLFADHGNEVFLGLTKLDKVSHERAQEIGLLIVEIGNMLSQRHSDHEFELKEEYLKEEFLDDPLHQSMIGFHSYHLTLVVQLLLEGFAPRDAIKSVRQRMRKEGE